MLGLGTSGQWDYNKVETPTVVFFKGAYHLFYSGGNQTEGVYKIGHAVSADGMTTWTKDTTEILSPANVASATGLANILHVAEPAAMVHGSGDTTEIWLYFCVTSQRSGPGPTSKMAVYRATSTDGQNFTNISLVLEQGPLYPANAGYNGYSTPSVLVSNRGIELFYDVYKHTDSAIAADEQVALHHALSPDGVHFTENSRTLLWNSAHNWTAREIRAGNALIVGNEYYLWFAADNYSNVNGTWAGGMAIGLAHWVK
jgi:hypothetical protein